MNTRRPRDRPSSVRPKPLRFEIFVRKQRWQVKPDSGWRARVNNAPWAAADPANPPPRPLSGNENPTRSRRPAVAGDIDPVRAKVDADEIGAGTTRMPGYLAAGQSQPIGCPRARYTRRGRFSVSVIRPRIAL
jgi:hypothetical protein